MPRTKPTSASPGPTEMPVKLHPHEIDQVRAAASAAGKTLSHFVRDRLGLPIPKRGRPPASESAR